jgi:hypothetical protein
VLAALIVGVTLTTRAQDAAQSVAAVPLQPLAQQARRVETALRYLGQPLSATDHQAIDTAIALTDEQDGAARIQQVLDRSVLVNVRISPESRVSVEPGAARPELVQGGTRLFLVKVFNAAHVTRGVTVQSPNAGRVFVPSTNDPEPRKELTDVQVRERWADVSLYDKAPMRARLSGLDVEYLILQIYSRDRGQRSATLSFDVGQGSQDVGFRSEIDVLFTARPAYAVRLHVLDEQGQPATAAFLVEDDLGRIYPSVSKRLAPDFFFQPQVYRADGATLDLPPGAFTLTVSRGPEYLPQTRRFIVGDGAGEVSFRLQRWIDPAKDGWYSGDHHIHSAGCSHYENPTEGVRPEDMWPQIDGEGLHVASVLTWGPSYYFQKQFFSGADHPLSTPSRLMHYDLEVSGFPSSHAGHLVLLGLKDQEYPGTARIEDWPSWTLPVLKWAKAQGAVVGFAHSGWGLEVRSTDLPNYEMPAFDGIGANEFVVDVTEPGAVDFISAGDTPYVWELNVWYHTLNAGFRARISGETDWPCITDDRVGLARSYAKVDGALTYRKWIDAVQAGRNYVSDGRSHLLDFTVDGTPVGGDHAAPADAGSTGEVRVDAPRRVIVTVRAAANLDVHPNAAIRAKRYDEVPYWDVERARIGDTRTVPVEVVINGTVAATQTLVADGTIRTITFDVPLERSSWIAVRILPSSHTNPIFALVGGRPVRGSRRSVQWCLDAVNQCWSQKAGQIRADERDAARQAYDRARQVYRARLADATEPDGGKHP